MQIIVTHEEKKRPLCEWKFFLGGNCLESEVVRYFLGMSRK